MADKSWKAFERRIAKLFGCTRRGPIFRSKDGGTDDCTSERYAIECKLLARPTFSAMLDACCQAEGSASVLKCVAVDDADKSVTYNSVMVRHPIAIVKRKRDEDRNALVCMRLETFLQWQNKGETP